MDLHGCNWYVVESCNFFLIVLSVGGSRRPEGQGKEENGGVTV